MSKRLQVILKDTEYREIQRAARSRKMSLAEWVRHALRFTRRQESQGSVSQKLAAIHRAAQYQFPTANVDEMLCQIESGY